MIFISSITAKIEEKEKPKRGVVRVGYGGGGVFPANAFASSGWNYVPQQFVTFPQSYPSFTQAVIPRPVPSFSPVLFNSLQSPSIPHFSSPIAHAPPPPPIVDVPSTPSFDIAQTATEAATAREAADAAQQRVAIAKQAVAAAQQEVAAAKEAASSAQRVAEAKEAALAAQRAAAAKEAAVVAQRAAAAREAALAAQRVSAAKEAAAAARRLAAAKEAAAAAQRIATTPSISIGPGVKSYGY